MPRLKNKLNQEEVQTIRSNLNSANSSIEMLDWDRASWIEFARDMFDEQEYDLVIDNLMNVRQFDNLVSSLEMIKKTIEKTIEQDPLSKQTHDAKGKPMEKDKYGNTLYDLDEVPDFDNGLGSKAIDTKKLIN